MLMTKSYIKYLKERLDFHKRMMYDKDTDERGCEYHKWQVESLTNEIEYLEERT